MDVSEREQKLRYYAALIDLKQEEYGNDRGIAAARTAARVLDELGSLTDADYLVIDRATRQYAAERMASGAAA